MCLRLARRPSTDLWDLLVRFGAKVGRPPRTCYVGTSSMKPIIISRRTVLRRSVAMASGLVASCGAGVRLSQTAPAKSKRLTRREVEQANFKVLSKALTSLGYKAPSLDPRLSSECRAYAELLERTQTAKHAAVDLAEQISQGRPSQHAPERSAGKLLSTLVHRLAILNRAAWPLHGERTPNSIGIGYAPSSRVWKIVYRWRNRDYLDQIRTEHVQSWPPVGATGVGTRFGYEVPNPLPQGVRGPAGYPFSVQLYGVQARDVLDPRAELEELPSTSREEPRPVSVYVLDSTSRAVAKTIWGCVVIATIPKAPLKSNTRYRATFSWAVPEGAGVKKRTWVIDATTGTLHY